MVVKHLNQIELSRRWSLSPRTLERWRWLKQGPDYLKVGGRVVYRLEDIELFEIERPAAHRRITPSVAIHPNPKFSPPTRSTAFVCECFAVALERRGS